MSRHVSNILPSNRRLPAGLEALLHLPARRQWETEVRRRQEGVRDGPGERQVSRGWTRAHLERCRAGLQPDQHPKAEILGSPDLPPASLKSGSLGLLQCPLSTRGAWASVAMVSAHVHAPVQRVTHLWRPKAVGAPAGGTAGPREVCPLHSLSLGSIPRHQASFIPALRQPWPWSCRCTDRQTEMQTSRQNVQTVLG